eukprot:521474_1
MPTGTFQFSSHFCYLIMGVCVSSPNQKKKEHPKLVSVDPNITRQDTHFFLRSKLNEGYDYNDLVLNFDSTTAIKTQSSEFVTPKSYHAYSFGSYPQQHYLNKKE